MAEKTCIYCGGQVDENGYCLSCKLSQDFLRKAVYTSIYYYNIGLDRSRMGNLTGARESLVMSLRYNKTNIDARNLLGLICYQMGDTVEAIRHWVMSVNYRPEANAAVRYLKELREKPKTIEKENDAARTFNIALDHAKRKEFDLAVIQLKKCLSENKRFLQAYLLMALIEIECKKPGTAKKYIARVISVDRNNPTALHFLRELGTSEDAINRMAEDGQEEDSEALFNYYGMELRPGERPARKIFPEKKEGRRNLQRDNRKEQNLTRFSNIYMLVGIIIGAAVFFFLLAPEIRQKADTKQQTMETNYNETLASKNSEIESLTQAVTTLSEQNQAFASSTDAMQGTIDDLTGEVESLKQSIANGTAVVTSQSESTAEDTDADEETNEAANRNNANVEGISQDEIQNMIQSE